VVAAAVVAAAVAAVAVAVAAAAVAVEAELAAEPEAVARHSYHPRRRRLRLPPSKEERPGVSATSWKPPRLPIPYLTHSLTRHPARAILLQ
jgi:hypothetical protein